MKTLLSTLSTIIRSIIVVFTIIAVVFGGANSAQRLFDAYKNVDKTGIEINDSAQLISGPPDQDEKPGNMGDGKPNTEPSAYINSGLAVSTIKSKENSYSCINQSILNTLSIPVREFNLTSPISVAQVSTKLAGIFTLIGSKPSGTG